MVGFGLPVRFATADRFAAPDRYTIPSGLAIGEPTVDTGAFDVVGVAAGEVGGVPVGEFVGVPLSVGDGDTVPVGPVVGLGEASGCGPLGLAAQLAEDDGCDLWWPDAGPVAPDGPPIGLPLWLSARPAGVCGFTPGSGSTTTPVSDTTDRSWVSAYPPATATTTAVATATVRSQP